jgi:hypothetical protein
MDNENDSHDNSVNTETGNSNANNNANNNTNNNTSNNSNDDSNDDDNDDDTHTIVIEPGLEINQIINNDSEFFINTTTFISTEPDKYDPNITENLSQVIEIYEDNRNIGLMNQIKDYASKINCSDFHGKGTIDDYSELFKAASKIANESKQIQLDIDVEGFDEFSQAADDLSNLFESFTLRLQNINIINDSVFLTSIVSALEKIWKLSETFGKFKQTILATTTITIPKTAHETAVILNGVMDEINCAMNYITHFVSPTDNCLVDSELSSEEKNIISKAVDTIDNWNVVCEYGVTIAMKNNVDFKAIKGYSDSLKTKAVIIKNNTATLRNKLNNFMTL